MKNDKEKKKIEDKFYQYYDTRPEDIRPFNEPVPKEVQERKNKLFARLEKLKKAK